MDVFAHALWTHAVHRSTLLVKGVRPQRRNIWVAVFFGLAPDLFSFGFLFATRIYHWLFAGGEFFLSGPPNPGTVPRYVFESYNYTHSLVIFLAVFGLVWLVRKKPYWLMFGWGMHILFDVFSHSKALFPTPFLFPIADVKVNGWRWGDPTFMTINYSLLVVTYLAIFIFSNKRGRDRNQAANRTE